MTNYAENSNTISIMKTLNASRPNTGVADELLSSGNVILSCGEDSAEVLQAFEPLLKAQPQQLHCYRGYSFTRYDHFTLVTAGIGTGCLEPLMYEILPLTRRIILIGTAGIVSGTADMLGRTYFICQAFLAGAAVHLQEGQQPLTPRFTGLSLSLLQPAVSVSSDYYYAFGALGSNDRRKVRAQLCDGQLRKKIHKHLLPGRLIDMEIGQFYHLSRIYGGDDLQYLAIKGVSNAAENFSEQHSNSLAVLQTSARHALRMLEAA